MSDCYTATIWDASKYAYEQPRKITPILSQILLLTCMAEIASQQNNSRELTTCNGDVNVTVISSKRKEMDVTDPGRAVGDVVVNIAVCISSTFLGAVSGSVLPS